MVRSGNDNMVYWTKREHNAAADHLCNVSLDGHPDFSYNATDVEDNRLASGFILIMSDGGFRRTAGQGATAYVTYSVTAAGLECISFGFKRIAEA